MEYPILIIRKDDNKEFIHLGNGQYRTKWGILNNSTSKIPFKTFNPIKFKFYYSMSESLKSVAYNR
jgi:hypothetical protein